MSLQQLAAQRMAAQGRGPDTQLVHMSPREVAGLQALAMAQGGSLTINPETGLPEAGFLDSMLPMILGIGAMALTGGAAAPAMTGLFGMGMPATIGLGVGALQTARTGSLEKGLMAGLGAYGGAGLAGGLMAAGAGAGAGAGAAGAAGAEVGSLGAAQAAPAFDPAGMVASPYYDPASLMSPVEVTGTEQAARFMPYKPEFSLERVAAGLPPPNATGQGAAYEAALKGDIGRVAELLDERELYPDKFPDRIMGQYSYNTVGGGSSLSLPTDQPLHKLVTLPPIPNATSVTEPLSLADLAPSPPSLDIQPVDAANRLSPGDVALRKQPVPSFGNNLRQIGRGISALAEPGGREAFMGQAASKGVEATGVGGGMGLLKYGMAAATPMLMGGSKRKMPAEDNERYNYRFDAGRTEEGYVDPVTGTRQYFRPTYTRYAAAGGPVEDMSISNVYDMQNARGGVSDMGIDNSTGMQRMASGGISALKPLAGYGDDEGRNNYSYDPATKTYAKLAPVIPPAAIAATLNALEAGGYGSGEMGGGPAGPTSGGAYSGVTSASFDAANMGEGSLSSGGGPSGATADAAGGTNAGGGTDYGSSGFGDYAGGGLAALAGGGITGNGELNLNIPLNFGGGGGGGFGGGFNQGPLDLGQNRTGFGQSAGNVYQPAGSGASSSPPGFLAPKPSSTVGLTENPFNLGTQLASRLGSANQNPFAAQPTPEMMAAQREANAFNPAGNLADLQRRVGDREQSFDEFQDRRIRNSVREPGDRMPTAAELQSGYKDYVQDRNNNLAKIGDLQQILSGQARDKEMMDRIRGMQQGRFAELAHVLQPGTAQYDNYMKNRGPSNQFERFADGGMAGGGISHLGDYSDGGRLLRGPGDGVSDSIPAMIGRKQPARLADGEFVVPARIVSELGNGSTEAGARKLYAMMDRVQKARGKTTGKNKVAKNTRADKYLPA